LKQFKANRIINLAIAGHGGSGKTSLVEAILFRAKSIDRLGKISEGNTTSDYDLEEIKRKVSLNIALCQFEYSEYKVNIIDTPGLFDFAGGMVEGVRAANTVLITVSGKSGVNVGTKNAYNLANKEKKSTMFFISKMDNENTDYYKVLEQLKANFGPSVCPIVVPFIQDGKVECYINLIDMKAFVYDKNGIATSVAMPDTEHRLDGLVTAISEAVAETDEELFEKYFSGEKFTHYEFMNGIHNGIKNGIITPVFCGSSTDLAGIDMLLDGITQMLPSSEESASEIGYDKDNNEIVVECDETKPLVSYVFKTVADPFVGKMSYIKVVSGKITPDSNVFNMTTSENERFSKILSLKGKKQEDIKEIVAGDIGVATKLGANTGDTLVDPNFKVTLKKSEFPNPCYSLAIKTKEQGDEAKISQGITRLLEEDLTLAFEINNETHEQIISGLGEQHLDVCISKLKSKFGVEVVLELPTIAYREAILKKVKVEGKHKKQTGGHGQFGHVWIEFEPCECDDLVFQDKVFGGAVPKSYFPAVEKGLRDSIKKGVVAGYPMVGLKATLVDGSYHPVDSSEMAFKMAAGIAYRQGISQAQPVLLEPIGKLQAVVPDANTGDIMGELNKRRGRVLGLIPGDNSQTQIDAEVPASQMQDFATYLRQATHGSGSFKFAFERYEQLPSNLEAEVIEKSKMQSV
jgi:elongation factor G